MGDTHSTKRTKRSSNGVTIRQKRPPLPRRTSLQSLILEESYKNPWKQLLNNPCRDWKPSLAHKSRNTSPRNSYHIESHPKRLLRMENIHQEATAHTCAHSWMTNRCQLNPNPQRYRHHGFFWSSIQAVIQGLRRKSSREDRERGRRRPRGWCEQGLRDSEHSIHLIYPCVKRGSAIVSQNGSNKRHSAPNCARFVAAGGWGTWQVSLMARLIWKKATVESKQGIVLADIGATCQ